MFAFNTLLSYVTPNPANVHERVPAFELVLGKWLPMPMFEMQHGVSGDVPYAWCRVRVDRVGEPAPDGRARYRFTWAFDTQTSDDEMSMFRPAFPAEGIDTMEFGLCNKVSNMILFMSPTGSFNVFSQYVAQLLGLDPTRTTYRYIGFYIYLVNFIRLVGASPEVTLHRCPRLRPRFLWIWCLTSVTRAPAACFLKTVISPRPPCSASAILPTLRTPTSIPFDMRLVFEQADFANDIVIEEEDMFRYPSMVRIGDEARRLVYRSLESEGLWAGTSNYSSPKRYLWDEAPFKQKWEYLTAETDPLYIRESENIYVPGLFRPLQQQGRVLYATLSPRRSLPTGIRIIRAPRL